MCLLPRATLHSDSEQLLLTITYTVQNLASGQSRRTFQQSSGWYHRQFRGIGNNNIHTVQGRTVQYILLLIDHIHR